MGLLFLLLPPAEVLLGIKLAKAFGGWWVLAGLLGGAVLGSMLIRLRGQAFFRKAMAAMQRQEMPAEELVGGIAWYVAGALLIFPGFISDVLALVVLLPPVRRRVLERFRRQAEEQLVRMNGGAAFQWTSQGGWQGPTAGGTQGGQVYEGEGHEVVEDAPRLRDSADTLAGRENRPDAGRD